MNIPLDWIGVVLNLVGCYLNAKKSITCWPVWLIANAFWVVHWWPKNEWAALILVVIYSGLNVYGYYEWKKEDNKMLKKVGENKETGEEKEARQKAIIEEVNCMLENMETSAMLLGTEDDNYKYADAIVGVMDNPRPAVVYDGDKVILALMDMNEWTYEDAAEWYGYNTLRSLPYQPKEDNPPVLLNSVQV